MTKQLILYIALLCGATAFAESSPLPKDYVYVRKNVAPKDSASIIASQQKDLKVPSDSSFSESSPHAGSFSFAKVTKWCKVNSVADNLSVSFTLGTGGLGLEVSTPLTSRARLRTGIEWVPSFTVPLNFELSSYTDHGASNDVSHIQEMVKDLMGLDMDDKVTMDAKPHMLNYKLIADIFPFRNNRHWYVSAGFYLGSPIIGKAKNNRAEMQTLVGVNIYNRAYRYFTSPDFDPYMVGIGNGTYLDPEVAMEYRDKFERYGSVGIHIGNFKDGTPYIMEPTKDGKVSATAKTNNFRPYLGIGYSGSVDKAGRLDLGFDAGVLFWGGAPEVINHDGVNMTKDLVDIRGKVGDYMKVIKALPVYPLINFKITYTIF